MTRPTPPAPQHTPEPWCVREGRYPYSPVPIGAKRFHIASVFSGQCEGVHSYADELPRREANAARIVACVNVLAGIPTEALESISRIVDPIHRLGTLADLLHVERIKLESLK